MSAGITLNILQRKSVPHKCCSGCVVASRCPWHERHRRQISQTKRYMPAGYCLEKTSYRYSRTVWGSLRATTPCMCFQACGLWRRWSFTQERRGTAFRGLLALQSSTGNGLIMVPHFELSHILLCSTWVHSCRAQTAVLPSLISVPFLQMHRHCAIPAVWCLACTLTQARAAHAGRRPKTLNALNEGMCRTLRRLYADWEASPDVHAIVIKGAGGKAFCAGGDVKGVVQLILAGKREEALRWGNGRWGWYDRHALCGRHTPAESTVINLCSWQ